MTISFLGAGRTPSFLISTGPLGYRLGLLFGTDAPRSLIGQGTGTSTAGISLLGATSLDVASTHGTYSGYFLDGTFFRTAEGGLGKTLLELGLVGAALYAGVFFSVLAPIVRFIRRLDGIGCSLVVLVLALGIIFLKGHEALDDPLIQPLFWLCAGGAWGRMSTLVSTGRGGAVTALPAVSGRDSAPAPAPRHWA